MGNKKIYSLEEATKYVNEVLGGLLKDYTRLGGFQKRVTKATLTKALVEFMDDIPKDFLEKEAIKKCLDKITYHTGISLEDKNN